MVKSIERSAPSMPANGAAATLIKSEPHSSNTGRSARSPADSLKRCDYLAERLNVYVFAALHTYKDDPVNKLWAMKKARDRAASVAAILSRMISKMEMEPTR